MGRFIFKAIVILAILGALAVVGYAYFGDMAADSTEQRLEVTLPGAPAPTGDTGAASGY